MEWTTKSANVLNSIFFSDAISAVEANLIIRLGDDDQSVAIASTSTNQAGNSGGESPVAGPSTSVVKSVAVAVPVAAEHHPSTSTSAVLTSVSQTNAVRRLSSKNSIPSAVATNFAVSTTKKRARSPDKQPTDQMVKITEYGPRFAPSHCPVCQVAVLSALESRYHVIYHEWKCCAVCHRSLAEVNLKQHMLTCLLQSGKLTDDEMMAYMQPCSVRLTKKDHLEPPQQPKMEALVPQPEMKAPLPQQEPFQADQEAPQTEQQSFRAEQQPSQSHEQSKSPRQFFRPEQTTPQQFFRQEKKQRQQQQHPKEQRESPPPMDSIVKAETTPESKANGAPHSKSGLRKGEQHDAKVKKKQSKRKDDERKSLPTSMFDCLLLILCLILLQARPFISVLRKPAPSQRQTYVNRSRKMSKKNWWKLTTPAEQYRWCGSRTLSVIECLLNKTGL